VKRAVAWALRSPAAREFFRYAVVGGISFLCDYGTLRLAVGLLGLHYLLGAALGFGVGLAVNFTLAERFVFGAPKVAARAVRFSGYALIGAVGLGLLEALMWLQVDCLGWDYRAAKITATVLVYLWNYGARRRLYAHPAGQPALDGTTETDGAGRPAEATEAAEADGTIRTDEATHKGEPAGTGGQAKLAKTDNAAEANRPTAAAAAAAAAAAELTGAACLANPARSLEPSENDPYATTTGRA
jgi:putative flippase GtrA